MFDSVSLKNVAWPSVLSAMALFLGVELGERQAASMQKQQQLLEMRQTLQKERADIQSMRDEITAELDAFALRLGSMRAHLLRLDALGERLVNVGKLDAGEFDFSGEPARGGLGLGVGETLNTRDLGRELDTLVRLLDDREHKLELLETLLSRRELHEQIIPSGRPVKKGFITSSFGRRTDPFTGKKKYHKGLDFSGKRGDEVVAVAAGIVIKSEVVRGYGNVVEIRHPDGYETRYAHNQENLVKVGDRVEKGETIALLGSTGRSSGPHVHFEVLRNGKIMDPARFIAKG